MAETPVISPLLMDRSEPIGNSDDGTGRRALHVRMSGAIVAVNYDQILASYPDIVTEVYTYKLTGLTVATVTVVYTDSTKANLSSVTKT
jgi:hypothetical protein